MKGDGETRVEKKEYCCIFKLISVQSPLGFSLIQQLNGGKWISPTCTFSDRNISCRSAEAQWHDMCQVTQSNWWAEPTNSQMSTGWELEYSQVKSRLDLYEVIKIIYYFWTELEASSSEIINIGLLIQSLHNPAVSQICNPVSTPMWRMWPSETQNWSN